MGQQQVFGHSVGEPVDPILSGPLDDLTSIHKSESNPDGSKFRPHISPLTSYYRSLEIKKKSSYSIQENNNLQNKMIERTYHEVLHPLLAVLTPHERLYK